MAHATSINPDEAAHFGKLAGDWWNPKGSSAMLHRLNPVRLRYIRDQGDRHWHGDGAARHPLAGRRALDMGCGAGLLTEPLARLGAEVIGVDAAPENIEAARAHAAQSGLTVDYRHGEIEAIQGATFDLVTCLEVVEHVTDPAAFVAGLAGAMATGGLLIMSTPNRTTLSKIALIGIGETIGGIPPGTHDWDKFLTPEELTALLRDAGLGVVDTTGIAFRPATGFALTDDLRLNYLIAATRA